MKKFRSKNNREPVHIGSIIDRVIRNCRPEPVGQLAKVWDIWDQAVGPTIAANAKPVAFKGKLLLVKVNSSPWLQQLQFLKADILVKVNRALGRELIGDIRFKIGPLN
jgi:predicted nucleic acid-binding Zn ribbon protein